jgi:hypothetical protein
MTAFWDIAPCCLLEVYQHFRGTYCLHHQDDGSDIRNDSIIRAMSLPDDGGCARLWNVGQLLRDFTAQYPRRLSSSCSRPWEPEISLGYLKPSIVKRQSDVATCTIWSPVNTNEITLNWTETQFHLIVSHKTLLQFGLIKYIMNMKYQHAHVLKIQCQILKAQFFFWNLSLNVSSVVLYSEWSKSHATRNTWPDTCSVCQKNKLHCNQKTKKNVILSVEMSIAFSDACIHSFPHVWCNLVKSSCVTETVHQTRYCRFVWRRRIRKSIPKLILAS